MALRIQNVVSGKINNLKSSSTQIELVLASGEKIARNLAGDLRGPIRGRRFEFCPQFSSRFDSAGRQIEGASSRPSRDGNVDEAQARLVQGVSDVGEVGEMVFRMMRVPKVSEDEMKQLILAGRPIPVEVSPVLYLEWFCQDLGRVVAEVVNPMLEFTDERPPVFPLPLSQSPAEASTQGEKVDGMGPEATTDSKDDPYQLFPSRLEEDLKRSLHSDSEMQVISEVDQLSNDNGSSGSVNQTRDWAEVIPGIAPETKAMYEKWDEICHGENEVPILELLKGRYQRPPMESLKSDEAAEPYLEKLLDLLGEFNVVIDLCDHVTPLSTLKLLVDTILDEVSVHPDSVSTGFFTHYPTWEWCQECHDEMDPYADED